MEQLLQRFQRLLHLREISRGDCIMNLFKTCKLATTATAIALCAMGAIAAETFGRAGGAVGTERVQQLAVVKAPQRDTTPAPSNWYGRAGGPVGVQPTAGSNKPKAYAAVQGKTPQVFGRAGVALPFGG
jgi:hypothetical protein